MLNFVRVVKNIPTWFRCGIMGVLGLIVAAAVDYIFCGKNKCRLGALTEYTAEASETIVHHIGKALGVRYEYVPYFPSRTTQIFLSALDIATPLLIWFVLGVGMYVVVRLLRNLLRFQDSHVRAD
jgi:hypothetical protein